MACGVWRMGHEGVGPGKRYVGYEGWGVGCGRGVWESVWGVGDGMWEVACGVQGMGMEVLSMGCVGCVGCGGGGMERVCGVWGMG